MAQLMDRLLKLARLEWQRSLPTELDRPELRNSIGCCSGRHFDSAIGWHPLPNERVCLREQKWRRYVRLRDNDPKFPFRQRVEEF